MEKLCKISEIAEWQGVTHWTIRGWIRKLGMQHHKIGRSIKLKKSEVTKFLEYQEYLQKAV